MTSIYVFEKGTDVARVFKDAVARVDGDRLTITCSGEVVGQFDTRELKKWYAEK